MKEKMDGCMGNGIRIRGMLAVWFLLGMMFAAACGKQEKDWKDLEFTVVEEGRLPEELRKLVEEKKEEPFKMTYADGGYLYLCVGYGRQQTGGYSITVNRLGATEHTVCLDTNLLGPTQAELQNASPSFPWLVVKIPFVDKTVVFE